MSKNREEVYCIRTRADTWAIDLERFYRSASIALKWLRLPKPFLLLAAAEMGLAAAGWIDSMSLELDALSFRVIVESDLNVEGMLIEPGKNNTDKLH